MASMSFRKNGKGFAPYLLSFLLIVFLLASLVLYGEENLFMDFGDPERIYSDWALYLTIASYVPVLVAVQWVGSRKFGIKTSWRWLSLAVLFLILSLVGIWLVPGPLKNGQTMFLPELSGQIRYSVLSLYVSAGLYYLLAFAPKMVRGMDFYHFACSLVFVFTMITVCYSLIAEIDCYKSFFDGSYPKVLIPSSYFRNRNAYGFTIFIGVASMMFLEAKRPRLWRWPLMLGLTFLQLFIMSKSSIMATAIVFIGGFFWNAFRSIREHPFRNTMFLLLGLAIMGAVILFPFLDELGIGWFRPYPAILFNRLKQLINSIDGSGNARLDCFQITWDALKTSPLSQWFGYGFANWKNAIYAYHGGFLPIDNAYVEELAKGGIIGLALCIAMWVFFFVLIVRAMKRRSPYGLPLLLIYLGFLSRSFIEASSFLNPNITFAMLYVLLGLPLLSLEHFETEEFRKLSEEEALALPGYPWKPRGFLGAYAVLMPIAVILLYSLSASFDLASLFFGDIPSALASGMGILIAPFLLALGCSLIRKHPWKGSGLIALSLLEAFLGLGLPFLLEGYAPFVLAFAPLVVAIVLAYGWAPSPGEVMKGLLLYFLPGAILAFLPWIYSLSGEAFLGYPLAMGIVLVLSYYFMLDVLSGASSPFYPLWNRLEWRLLLFLRRREAKTERKYFRYRERKRRMPL